MIKTTLGGLAETAYCAAKYDVNTHAITPTKIVRVAKVCSKRRRSRPALTKARVTMVRLKQTGSRSWRDKSQEGLSAGLGLIVAELPNTVKLSRPQMELSTEYFHLTARLSSCNGSLRPITQGRKSASSSWRNDVTSRARIAGRGSIQLAAEWARLFQKDCVMRTYGDLRAVPLSVFLVRSVMVKMFIKECCATFCRSIFTPATYSLPDGSGTPATSPSWPRFDCCKSSIFSSQAACSRASSSVVKGSPGGASRPICSPVSVRR